MVSVKALVACAGCMVAGVGLAMTVHAQLVVPAIMREVSREISSAIDRHSIRPHPISVSREEFAMLKEAVTSGLRDVKDSVRSLSDKIDRQGN